MPSAAHSGVPSSGERPKAGIHTRVGHEAARGDVYGLAGPERRSGRPARDRSSTRARIDPCGRCRSRRRTHPHEPLYQVPLRLPWTHVALCLGRSEEYNADPALRDLIARASHGDPKEPVLIEALLGRGTILTPLRRYRTHAVKICRPSNLSEQQVGRVIRFAVRHLGFDYDLRHILDLVRLAVPLPSFAQRWRSTLFDPDYVASRRCICSTLLVQSFTSVAHPVVAVAAPHSDAAYKASLEANPRLATPRDFDGSPYFEYLEFPPELPRRCSRQGRSRGCHGLRSAGTGRRHTVQSWSVSRPGPGAMLRHGAVASSTTAPRETVNTIPPVFNRGASGTWRDQGTGLRC